MDNFKLKTRAVYIYAIVVLAAALVLIFFNRSDRRSVLDLLIEALSRRAAARSETRLSPNACTADSGKPSAMNSCSAKADGKHGSKDAVSRSSSKTGSGGY